MGMDETLYGMMVGELSDTPPGKTRVQTEVSPGATFSVLVPHGRRNVTVDFGNGRSMSLGRRTGIPKSVGRLLEEIHARGARS